MYRALVLLAMALGIVLGSGCGRESRSESPSDVQIGMSAIPFPAAVGKSRLVIQVKDNAGTPINNATLSIKVDMTHAGMVPVLAEKQGGAEDGFYDVPFEWTMAGDWVVTVDAVLDDDSRARQHFEFTVLSEDESVCTHDEPGG